MIVKRNVPKPNKSFYIAGRNSEENDLNIHLYNEVINGKRLFSFIISKDKKEEATVVDKNNIISMVHFEEQADIKAFVSGFGNAIKAVRSLDRPFYDHDFIDAMEKNISNLKHEIWKKKTATRYLTPAQKQEITNRPKYEKSASNYGAEDADLKATKPIVMIETLEKMGLIRILRTEPNGDETKFKFELNTGSSTEFNISVVRHHGLAGNKAEIFKDFYNDHKKGLGSGGLGILTHLAEYGLLGNIPDNESNQEKMNRAKEFFKSQILSNVKKEDMVYTKASFSKLYLDKSITFEPIKKTNQRTDKLLQDFLSFRGISQKLIKKCYDEDLAFSGDFYVSRIQKEMKEDRSGYKDNYGYTNAPYFRLRTQGNKFFGAERFQINKTNNKEKPFNYDKMNTGAVDGKYFSFGEEKNPKLAIIHEAIIDSLSSYDLLDEAGADADAVRYFSTQSATNFKKFFLKNLGFRTNVSKEITEKQKQNRTMVVYLNQTNKDLTPELIDEYRQQLEDKKVIFIDYGDTSKTMLSQIGILNDVLGGKVEIIKKDNRESVNFKDYDSSNSLIIDKVNFSDFLSKMKLNFEYDTKARKSIIKTFYTRENEVPLDDRKKEVIKSKIKRFFGTDNLAFGLDNDHAGLPYVIAFTEMKRHFGINVNYMIPDDLAYDNFQGLTLKKMMGQYENLCEQDKYEEAYELIHKYIEQKPKVDNNDVLKNYQDLKARKPEEAKKILQYKLEQLNIDKGSDLFPKKKAKRNQRPS